MSPRRVPGLSGSFIQLTFVTFRAANIRPYGVACTIQLTLNKERTAVALFSQPYGLPASQGKLLEGAVAWCHSTGCYRNREVEGRQIADPYGLRNFW